MRVLFLYLFLFLVQTIVAQSNKSVSVLQPPAKDASRVMFYNCENFFDCQDDTLNTGDDTYLPYGDLHWTNKRFRLKRNALARAIIGIGTSKPPVLVGLCEIENASVLNELCYESPLQSAHYKFIHRNSPDHRGIDVALLYLPSLFKPLETRFLRGAEPWSSREMLAVKGVLNGADTLYLVVCHWPSKKGGAVGERLRKEVATVAASYADSVLSANPQAVLIFCGDFNDESSSAAINILCQNRNRERLIDLAQRVVPDNLGSHKFRGHWSVIDHFIVSPQLTKKESLMHLTNNQMYLGALPFLLENDETALGVKPFRTYLGFRYHGGTSDHLPVYIDLQRYKH
jgi:endonuclease/exonuclease/phosphatase family metal-dependent hydrolase